MNISFFDGVNDGKFYSINAGKYDELGEEDIDISEGVNEEIEDEDNDTCLNRFEALEKDASKLHMDLNNLRNEFKGSCKDWNNLSDTVDHMLNSIAELRTMMDKVNDRVNNRFKVVSEATAELADKLSLVEKKLEVFKCIDILDRVTKLEEQVEKLERGLTSNGMLIADFGRHINDTDCNLSSLSDRVSKLDSKLAVTAKIVDTINGTISGYGHDYVIIADRINEVESKLGKLEEQVISTQLTLHSIDLRLNGLNELEKKVNEELNWKDLTGTAAFESNKNDILDKVSHLEEKIEKLDMDVTSNMENIIDKTDKLDERCNIHDILERRWKGYHWVPFDYKFGAKTESVEDLEKRIGMSRKYTESLFKSNKNDIQDDPVNHPSHYTDGKYECIDFIEEYGMVTHIGNAIKYISRNGKKDTSKYAEDLNKAFWYLHRYNTPQSMGHINAIDYCNEKKLPIELAGVIIDISHGEYKHAEELLGDYITKITGKTPKALEDEQSK